MKLLNNFLAALLAVGMAMGCSNDDVVNDVDGGSVVNPGDKVYVSVSVSLPTAGKGTRSTTVDPEDGSSASDDKTEVGKDHENTVKRMLIVLARPGDNGYITSGTVDTGLEMSQTSVRATSKLSKTALAAYYNNNALSDQRVNVFVICNYTDDLLASFKTSDDSQSGFALGDTSWIDKVCEVSETAGKNTSIWARGAMLMTNATIATKMLPRTFKEWDLYSSASVPLDLSINSSTSSGDRLENNGPVRVERSVARFDFRDGSELGGNKYHVVATKLTAEAEPVDIVDIELNRMALVNMSNKFYYFRRVTAAGTIEGGVCRPEIPWGTAPGNYVVDVDYDTKAPGPAAYNFPLFRVGSESDNGVIDATAREQWYTSPIAEVLGTDKENDEYTGDGATSYKIWRYVTENTVNETKRMTAGLSTGVVFKGRMIPTEAARTSSDEQIATLAKVLDYDMSDASLELNHNTNTDPILYTFGGNLYLRWPNVAKAALKAATLEDGTIVTTNSFYEAVFGKGAHEGEGQDVDSPNYLWHKWNDEGKTDDALQLFKKAATKNGITLYQSSEDDGKWGYYCYYFYWNRHDNNDNAGVMGDMEFAVVRNNVYKLAVTKINRLGHPRLSENDPDPVDPKDPDETGDVYISVSVEVLPWVVRVNEIEF